MNAAQRILLEGLIDYAGLYPPASLPMDEAVRNYASYRRAPDAARLGRFVLHAARLDEFIPARVAIGTGHGTWRLSALLGTDPLADLEHVIAFNEAAHAMPDAPAVVDTLEGRPATPDDLKRLETLVPAGVTAYFEIPPREPGPWLAALAEGGGRAKLRTGGVTPELIPHPADVARFLDACARAKIPFKATAGLHHPVRALRPLTYAPDAPRATMHGFLNVFMAAAFAKNGMGLADLSALVAEEDPAALACGDDGIRWRGHALNPDRLREARRDFAIAFGSCSFEEPRQDLEALGWH